MAARQSLRHARAPGSARHYNPALVATPRLATPAFVLGLLLARWLGAGLGAFPTAGDATPAHYVLPATTWMERPEVPYALQSFAGCNPTPYMIYADRVLAPPPGVRHEWWMYARLADSSDRALRAESHV